MGVNWAEYSVADFHVKYQAMVAFGLIGNRLDGNNLGAAAGAVAAAMRVDLVFSRGQREVRQGDIFGEIDSVAGDLHLAPIALADKINMQHSLKIAGNRAGFISGDVYRDTVFPQHRMDKLHAMRSGRQ